MKIKSLVWRENKDETSTVVCSCKTAIGFYKINEFSHCKYCVLFNGLPMGNSFDSADECKAYAKEHFESIVKKCLVE